MVFKCLVCIIPFHDSKKDLIGFQCDHYICDECFSEFKLNYSQCHICRQEIKEYQTIAFEDLKNLKSEEDRKLWNNEKLVYNAPTPKINDEENFHNFTKENLTKEISSLETALDHIHFSLFSSWNSSNELHERSFFEKTYEILGDAKYLNICNEAEDHYPHNKQILEKIQIVIANIDKLKKRKYTIEDKNSICNTDENLFQISVGEKFERVKIKKKKR